MSRTRPGRTRTKRTNRRKPLLLSSVHPQEFNVRAGEPASIVCPDCRTWRRIMGSTRLVIREHGDDRGEASARCPGSNQLVVVDIDVRAWQRRADRLLRDGMWADQRRTPRQHSKPLPPAAPPVSRLAGQPRQYHLPVISRTEVTRARQDLHEHFSACPDCTGERVCATYEAVADRVIQLEDAREQQIAAKGRKEDQAQRAAAEERTARAAGWQQVEPRVRAADRARAGLLATATARSS